MKLDHLVQSRNCIQWVCNRAFAWSPSGAFGRLVRGPLFEGGVAGSAHTNSLRWVCCRSSVVGMANSDNTCTVRLSTGMAGHLQDLGRQMGAFGTTRPRVIESLLIGHPTGAHVMACMLRHSVGGTGAVPPAKVLVPPGPEVRSGYEAGVRAGRQEAAVEARACRQGLLALVTGPSAENVRAELAVSGVEVLVDDALGIMVRFLE